LKQEYPSQESPQELTVAVGAVLPLGKGFDVLGTVVLLGLAAAGGERAGVPVLGLGVLLGLVVVLGLGVLLGGGVEVLGVGVGAGRDPGQLEEAGSVTALCRKAPNSPVALVALSWIEPVRMGRRVVRLQPGKQLRCIVAA
jgi:hypothetical protein